jgi:hypothetical protein
MTTDKVLTEAQRKALDEADAIFGRAYEQVASKLDAAGLRLPGEHQTSSCISCDCPEFMPGDKPGRCKRPYCQHSRTLHNWQLPR